MEKTELVNTFEDAIQNIKESTALLDISALKLPYDCGDNYYMRKKEIQSLIVSIENSVNYIESHWRTMKAHL